MNWLDACHVFGSAIFGLVGTLLYLSSIRGLLANRRFPWLLGSAALSLLAGSVLVWFYTVAGLVVGLWPLLMIGTLYTRGSVKVVSRVTGS